MATTTDGQLYVWGFDTYGQLGLGTPLANKYSPTAVPNVTNVTAIAAGADYSLAIANGQVLAWGYNAFCELGVGFASSYYPQPIASVFNYDIFSTNPPALPVVSITAPDPDAYEGTWLSAFDASYTNTGLFVISRAVASDSDLVINLAIGGSAVSGVDYAALPLTVTIPAGSNSVSFLVQPTGDTLAANPSTVVVSLVPDAAYEFGNTASATVSLSQYESSVNPPPPVMMFQLFVGTNLNGQLFDIQCSTNLIDWTDMGIGTNIWGIVKVPETNHMLFRQRFFRALPLSGQ